MGQTKSDAITVAQKLVVGVDIGKAEFVAATVWSGQHEYAGKTPNTPEGCAAFVKRMEELQQTWGAEAIHLLIEPTGGYELGLMTEAYRRHWRVTLVNPLNVRHWQQGRGKRGKTDRLDAMMLAAFGAEHNPPAQQPVEEAAAQLDSILRRQDDLTKLLQSERNRLAQAQLSPHTHAAVCDSLRRTLDNLESEQAQLDAALRQLFADHVKLARQLKLLRSVPGVGKKNAPHLLALFHRFQAKTNGEGTAKQLVAFTGLDPKPFESGSSVRRRPTISRQGDPALRSRLFFGALGGVRGHNRLRQLYSSFLARGKAKKLALVACARKSLVWAWAIFTQDTPFDSARFVTSESFSGDSHF